MGRTKKRHRAWKQQMKARAKKRRDWGFSWGDISPGRLVAWAEWTEEDKAVGSQANGHIGARQGREGGAE